MFVYIVTYPTSVQFPFLGPQNVVGSQSVSQSSSCSTEGQLTRIVLLSRGQFLPNNCIFSSNVLVSFMLFNQDRERQSFKFVHRFGNWLLCIFVNTNNRATHLNIFVYILILWFFSFLASFYENMWNYLKYKLCLAYLVNYNNYFEEMAVLECSRFVCVSMSVALLCLWIMIRISRLLR